MYILSSMYINWHLQLLYVTAKGEILREKTSGPMDDCNVKVVAGRTSLGPIIRDETRNGNVTDGDDELLESLVKTATKSPATRTTPRERKRTRHADLKRSRTRENNTTPVGYRP
ncbi:hypothetical protein PV327_003984 [Microctonus hyperodae]|uniref:Uncharacterized protein n=1 Tax=Microctonus hyperodae TaxID=165561 RepID=A0AA39G636_MICHY|nr:hypothetical protein PV327_003984 [Microctonus hyperodae]